MYCMPKRHEPSNGTGPFAGRRRQADAQNSLPRAPYLCAAHRFMRMVRPAESDADWLRILSRNFANSSQPAGSSQ